MMPNKTPHPEKERIAVRYLIKLVKRVTEIQAIADHEQAIAAFDDLYQAIYKPKSWEQFKINPIIADEAGKLLSSLKTELILTLPADEPQTESVSTIAVPSVPVDLSDLISKVQVHCDRLRIDRATVCQNRFGKPLQALSFEELSVWLEELTQMRPVFASSELSAWFNTILELRTELGLSKADMARLYRQKTGIDLNAKSCTELSVLAGLLQAELSDRQANEPKVESIPMEEEFF